MLVRHIPPPEGKRKLLCKTDEATVSRIHTPGKLHDGMVERLQRYGKTHDCETATFKIRDLSRNYQTHQLIKIRSELESVSEPSYTSYHIMKFMALRLARTLFPENFIDASELRLFEKEGERYAAMYSDFVGDDNNVVQRRKKTMSRFYAMCDDGRRYSLLRSSDKKEHELNPDLAGAVRRLKKAGLIIPHPEANYHLSGGKTVFFEVEGINIGRLLGHIYSMDDTTRAVDAAYDLSFIWAVRASHIEHGAGMQTIFPKSFYEIALMMIKYGGPPGLWIFSAEGTRSGAGHFNNLLEGFKKHQKARIDIGNCGDTEQVSRLVPIDYDVHDILESEAKR